MDRTGLEIAACLVGLALVSGYVVGAIANRDRGSTKGVGLWPMLTIVWIAGCDTAMVMGGYVWWRNAYGALADFDENFDRNLATDPVAAELAQQDPRLRQEIFRATRRAYARGGWPEARTELDNILWTHAQLYSDDAHFVAALRAEVEMYHALRATPDLCMQYSITGEVSAPSPEARAAIERFEAAYADAIRDGAARHRTQPDVKKPEPSEAEIRRVLEQAATLPAPLTEAEWQALAQYADADPTEYCDGTLKLAENELALPESEAADAERVLHQNVTTGRWADLMASLGVPADTVPEGFGCPKPGTRFFLNTVTADDRPVMQTVVGQHGFECRLDSTATGLYGWTGGLTDSRNGYHQERAAIRALWPLQVGKTANFAAREADGTTTRVSYSVVEYGRYAVPAGYFSAFEIDILFARHDGRQKYLLEEYWSPDLQWKIRHRFRRLAGNLPDGNIVTNWDLARIEPASGHTEP